MDIAIGGEARTGVRRAGDELARAIFAQQAVAIGRLFTIIVERHRSLTRTSSAAGWSRRRQEMRNWFVDLATPAHQAARRSSWRCASFAEVPDLDMAGARGAALRGLGSACGGGYDSGCAMTWSSRASVAVTLRGWLYRPARRAGAAAGCRDGSRLLRDASHGPGRVSRRFSAPPGSPCSSTTIAASATATASPGRRSTRGPSRATTATRSPGCAAQPGIDPERLALWGSSFSGGEVLVVGAVDPRVKAVIANVPFAGSARGSDRSVRSTRFEPRCGRRSRTRAARGPPTARSRRSVRWR